SFLCFGTGCTPTWHTSLGLSPGCQRCPHHIRTGEEARVTYKEFYDSFGFPYGLAPQEATQLLFYELRTPTGTLLQKGQSSSCPLHGLHPETLLFGGGGYLRSVMAVYANVGYVTLYCSHSPCNEAGHQCLSHIGHFLQDFPQARMDLYFSQLYHTGEEHPQSCWNWQGLRELASHWPRVTVSPLSGTRWSVLLDRFVLGTPKTAPLPLHGRAIADRINAYQIGVITGIGPVYVDTVPVSVHTEPSTRKPPPPPPPPYLRQSYHSWPFPVPQWASVPRRMEWYPPWRTVDIPERPKKVVRHIQLPSLASSERPFEAEEEEERREKSRMNKK
ncbi:putative C-_U-editing enzyme APOBEC-4, partial [Polypterus senegalus]|uniref:putative C->U-editing enzyme APOBEC-4 n=1 Tax=Polypterus senegalus TaxID=55291 RepID=UPI0019636FA2